jgi:hypothetical protein
MNFLLNFQITQPTPIPSIQMAHPIEMTHPMQMMYPMQMVPHPMQLNPENAQEKAKKVAKTKAKKVKVDEEIVEVCAVLYDCSNKMHPNFQ